MTTLISATFDEEDAATAAFDRMLELHSAALLRLTGLIWLFTASDGHLEIRTAQHDPTTPDVEAASASFAQIIGSLLTTPILGAAVGGTAKAVADRIAEDDDTPARQLRKTVAHILAPGKWSVVGYADDVAESAIRSELGDPADLSFWEIVPDAERQLAQDAGVK